MQSYQQIIGTQAEILAKKFLIKQGLTFVHHQYRVTCGEIDLIMKDKDEIVFVEVRYRQHLSYCEPEQTITHAKRRRLIKTALVFQLRHPWTEAYSARFDVITISGDKLNDKITWIPNAFGVQ